MCWVLDADINLGGGTIKAVGRHTTGFQGTLYGNKHVIKNGTVQYETWIDQTNDYACGLFHKINGGKVYDLTIDGSITLSMKNNIDANVWVHMGGLSAVATNATIVGVNSNVSINVAQTGTTKATYTKIGGLVGDLWAGTTKVIKCNYNGNIYVKPTASSYLGPDDSVWVGGLIGSVESNATIDQCSVKGTVETLYAGIDQGGLVGRFCNAESNLIKVSNIVLDVTVKATDSDGSPGAGIIFGWDSGIGAWNSASSISNVYILKGEVIANKASSSPLKCLCWTSASDISFFSNICVPANSGIVVRTTGSTNVDSNAGVAKKGDTAGVVSSANSNPAISNNYTLTDAGGITSKSTASTS